MKDLAAIAKNLYGVRREIKKLQGDEEMYRKQILKLYEDPIRIKTLDGRRTMEVVTDESIVLKDNETISQKIGAQKFYAIAKVTQTDLKKFCEEEGFKFKWFIKKKVEGATKIVFTE